MTQIEYEERERELRQQCAQERNQIELWQIENKQEMADVRKRLKELTVEIQKLEARKQMLSQRRLDCQVKWGNRISQFRRENFSTSRQLENISDVALVKELHSRGFHGTLMCIDPDDQSLGHLDKLNTILNGQ